VSGLRPIYGHYVLSMGESQVECGVSGIILTNFVVLLDVGESCSLLPTYAKTFTKSRPSTDLCLFSVSALFYCPAATFSCYTLMRLPPKLVSTNLDLIKDQAPWFSIPKGFLTTYHRESVSAPLILVRPSHHGTKQEKKETYGQPCAWICYHIHCKQDEA